MKPLLFGLMLSLITHSISAQEKLYDIMPMDSGKVVYRKAIMEDSLSKDEIFNKAKAWADNYYKFDKAKLIKEDNESGYLAYRASMPVHTFVYKPGSLGNQTPRLELRYHLEFHVEEGRYRIIMRDLYIRNPESPMTQLLSESPIEKYGKAWKGKAHEKFKQDIEGIHKGIIKLYLDIIESIHR